MNRFRFEILFLFFIYVLGLYFRLPPRLKIDPHLLTFNADIWYRLAIAQYAYDYGHLSSFSIRYLPHAFIPEWYPPEFIYFLVFLAKALKMDLPTVCSRVIPFFEALTPLSFFLMARYLYGRRIAVLSALALSLTTCFVYWNGIADPQSFITFMIPAAILIWVWYLNNLVKINRRPLFILAFGMMLAFSFVTHLMYFLMVIILLLVNFSLIMEKKAGPKSYIDLLAAIAVSQFATIFWWLPEKLYWWWINGLATSCGYQAIGKHFNDYGFIAMEFGLASFLFVAAYPIIARKRRPYILLPFFWGIFPLFETQNEVILKLINRIDLTWSPIFKPLEGFRFHPYLAQPFALCIGIAAVAAVDLFTRENNITWIKNISKRTIYVICAFLLGATLFYDIAVLSKIEERFQNSGISVSEYDAAVWFKANSKPTDVIIADYYKSQMLAGVCGGRSVVSLPFPLRVKNVKYVNQGEIQKFKDDVYKVYNTASAKEAHDLMKPYALTHIFISSSLDIIGNFGSAAHKGFGAKIDREKFKDVKFFEIVYNKKDVIIVKAKNVSGNR